MPPHDPERRPPSGAAATPGGTARRDLADRSGRVSTTFAPETGRRSSRRAVAGGILLLCFVVVGVLRIFHARSVAKSGEAAYSAPPPVDIVIARPVTGGQDLVLPGQTAAWFETTIYARVNGYVRSDWWILATTSRKVRYWRRSRRRTSMRSSRRRERSSKASEAQVAAREAEAEFAKTTNERWRDSPKGVVSEQERDSKKADYESAEARLYAANAQVALDKSKVDQYSALTEFKQVIAPLRRDHHGAQDRCGQSRHGGQHVDHDAAVSHGTDRSVAHLRRRPARRGRGVDETRRAGADSRNGRSRGCVAGKIARSAESINVQARTMRVEVDMPNAQHALVPGMYVTVAFTLPPRGRVEVPAAALIFPRAARRSHGSMRTTRSLRECRDRPRRWQHRRAGIGCDARRPAGAQHQQPDCAGANGFGQGAAIRLRSFGRQALREPDVQLTRATVFASMLGLAACAAGPNYRTPKPDVPPAFAARTEANTPATPSPLRRPWTSLPGGAR